MDLQLDPPAPARADAELAPGRAVRRPGRPSYSKVPEITAYFWIAKGLTTGMGESISDFLVHKLAAVNPISGAIAGLVCAAAKEVPQS
jgi:uncharacterized membrane-anchored protein